MAISIFNCYCLFRWYTSIQCYMGWAHITFDAGARDIEEELAIWKCQEVWVCTIVFGVFRLYDWSRRTQDRPCKDGGHHEVVGSSKRFWG